MTIQGQPTVPGAIELEAELDEARKNSKHVELFTSAKTLRFAAGEARTRNGTVIVPQAHETYVIPFHAIQMLKIS
ncbi:hypothetical protein [Methylobacterium pseudosasicola]|uniref:Uncharacterized protein n=1 Tax=Methylobacterium pseudosasicola TaxID=582667 RepID=A0A1I4VCN5_9HYPH|nr:hypothetical protein [Methylobacterium pseudosasicola]SFM98927.1 hypothetical protein SAMN05192568_10945 [Methylobacterium pseudosasicola]